MGAEIEAPVMNAIVSLDGLEVIVDLEGCIDVGAERKRLEKEQERLVKNISSKGNKLTNKKFVDNAPADIVQRERDGLEKVKEQLQKIRQSLANLPSA